MTTGFRRVIQAAAVVLLLGGSAMSMSPAFAETLALVDPYVHRSNFLVRDIDRALRLYRDILGFKVNALVPVKSESFMYDVFNIDRTARMRIAFLSSPDSRFGAIGMTEVKGIDLPPAATVFPSALIVEIKGRFESVYDQIRAANLDVGRVYELTNPARREFLVTDVDGHRIIIMQLHAAD